MPEAQGVVLGKAQSVLELLEELGSISDEVREKIWASLISLFLLGVTNFWWYFTDCPHILWSL